MATTADLMTGRATSEGGAAAPTRMETTPEAGVITRRWWVLAIVVAAQFMFGVDAFIVNVALPTIAAELQASAAQIEAVVAIYLIGYATLVITGGRLGDIHGVKATFITGVLGFTLTSLWCGLARSGPGDSDAKSRGVATGFRWRGSDCARPLANCVLAATR